MENPLQILPSSPSIPAIREAREYRASLETALQGETAEASLSLADIMEGAVPDTCLGGRSLPESVFGIHESGALPLSAAAFRDFRRKTNLKLLTASITLDSRTLSETKGYRIRAAYRLVSYLARVTGLMVGSERMGAALTPRPELDRYEPFTVPHLSPTGGARTGMYPVHRIIQAINSLQEPTSYLLEGEIISLKGLTYLPPPIPDRFYTAAGIKDLETVASMRDRGVSPPGYRPEDDERLCLWLDAMEYLSYYLGVNRGTESEPQSGIYGVLGLFSAKTARLCWPCADDLLNYETELLFYVGDIVSRRRTGKTSAVDISPEILVAQELGYTRSEAILLCNAASVFMSMVYNEDPDALKALEIARLDVIADRCIDSGDPRAEFAVMKHKHQMMGLTRSEESETLQAFRDMAAETLMKRAEPADLLE